MLDLLWMCEFINKFDLFHQVSSNSSDYVKEVIFRVFFRRQPKRYIIDQRWIFAERLENINTKLTLCSWMLIILKWLVQDWNAVSNFKCCNNYIVDYSKKQSINVCAHMLIHTTYFSFHCISMPMKPRHLNVCVDAKGNLSLCILELYF